ncbi:MAG: histone deacetylase [Anaerolineales bacterium]|jgi:acetoin utilization deacetylase AcuC-like enzyme
MKIFYSDPFTFPLPAGHRFPADKYKLLRERVLNEGYISVEDMHIPEPASDAQILLVHEREYLNKLKSGSLNEMEVRRLGFPWSHELIERSRRSVGGTIAACRSALEDSIAVNLSGGTHHAFPDHGQGFCVLNDAAIAARVMQEEALVQKLIILDCDVHQGNGTAAIFTDDPTVFTFSIHAQSNFPFHKEASDLDIALEDGVDDKQYLSALQSGLREALQAAQADQVIYLAGADPHHRDRLGKLALSKAGLAARDRLVMDLCLNSDLALAVVMSGGYGKRIEDTVEIHLQTVTIAAEMADRLKLPL